MADPAADRRTVRGRAGPALLDAVHAGLAALWADHPDVAERDRHLLATALGEVVGNIVAYAPASTNVAVELAVDERQLSADLDDDAAALPADVHVGATLPDDDAEHGRGLALAAAALDELEYRRAGTTNHWHLARYRDGGSASRSRA